MTFMEIEGHQLSMSLPMEGQWKDISCLWRSQWKDNGRTSAVFVAPNGDDTQSLSFFGNLVMRAKREILIWFEIVSNYDHIIVHATKVTVQRQNIYKLQRIAFILAAFHSFHCSNSTMYLLHQLLYQQSRGLANKYIENRIWLVSCKDLYDWIWSRN